MTQTETKTKTTPTVHGDVEYETVDCARCEATTAKEETETVLLDPTRDKVFRGDFEYRLYSDEIAQKHAYFGGVTAEVCPGCADHFTPDEKLITSRPGKAPPEPETEEVETAHGTVTYDVVDCVDCGETVKAEDATVIGRNAERIKLVDASFNWSLYKKHFPHGKYGYRVNYARHLCSHCRDDLDVDVDEPLIDVDRDTLIGVSMAVLAVLFVAFYTLLYVIVHV